MKTTKTIILLLWGILMSSSMQGQSRPGSVEELNRLISGRNFKEAIRVGTRELATDSLNPQIYYGLGVAYSNLKQYEMAIAAFVKSDQLLPGDKSLIINLADCYCEQADAAIAEILLSDLLKTDTTDVFVRLELARVFLRQGKTDPAINLYLKLWSEDSLNIWYPRQVGNLLARNERYKAAIPLLEIVTEADSSDQGSFLRLGQAYLVLKESEKIPVLDKAIRQDSMEPLLHRYRGGLWLGAGKYALAENDLKIACDLGDSSAFTFRHLGISQFQQSKYQDALLTFDKTVKIDSLDSEAWFYLGYCYKWTENIPQGIECLQRALKIAIPPSTASIYGGLGLFYNLTGDFKSSMTYYGKALEYNPEDPVPYSQMGLLVEKTTRDADQAKAYYERFINEYKGNDKNLVDYINYRLQAINEKLFMEGKLKKN